MDEEYKVLARKWRPEVFSDVVGQGHVLQTLRNAVTSSRIANAYLFVGPRGVGKTSIARIMAKALNCHRRTEGETDPCRPGAECDSCREIRESRSLDVLEFDAASNTQVEKVRELIIDNVKFRPSRDRWKIYIVDEVHMLSNSSFNALLKTLEEPPAHVRFMFATTEPQKVPVTILSRCQRFDLRRIATRDIVGQLAKIAGDEGIQIDADALLAVARGAEGGLRDAESALDQLVAFRGKQIAEEDVLSVFGLVSRKALEELSDALIAGDIPAVLTKVDAIEAAGKDISRLALELLDYFRNLLVIAHAGEALRDQDVPDAQYQTMTAQAGRVDGTRLLRMVELFIDLQGTLKFSLSRRTALEVALIRAARAATVASLDDVIRMVRQLQEQGGGGAPAGTSVHAPASAVRSSTPTPTPTVRPAAPAASAVIAPRAEGDELAALTARWHEVIDRVGVLAPLAKASMRDAKPVEVGAERVVIGLDPEFASRREVLVQPRSMQGIQAAFKNILGRVVNVQVTILGTGDHRLPTDHPPAATGAAGAAPAATGGANRRTRQDWEQQPEVRRALETFNGGIVDIRE